MSALDNKLLGMLLQNLSITFSVVGSRAFSHEKFWKFELPEFLEMHLKLINIKNYCS